MNAATALVEVAADPFATVRALNRMRAAGFALSVRSDKLVVAPAESLTDPQRAYLRRHKPALVALLSDAETLRRALIEAGPAGLGWREGTPPDWSDDRLLAAGDVLYADGRMANRHGRRHEPRSATTIEIGPECRPAAEAPEIAAVAPSANVVPLDREAYEERAAIMEFDGGLSRDEAERKALALAIRAANGPGRHELRRHGPVAAVTPGGDKTRYRRVFRNDKKGSQLAAIASLRRAPNLPEPPPRPCESG